MSRAWNDLHAHRSKLDGVTLRDLVRAPDRARDFVHTVGDFTVDLTRHLATPDTLTLLMALAREREVEAMRDAMFAGEPVNTTEGRAAMHMALRNCSDRPMQADGQDVMPGVRDVLRHMQSFCKSIHGVTEKNTRMDVHR